jgi:hypothetical protein
MTEEGFEFFVIFTGKRIQVQIASINYGKGGNLYG